MTQRPRVRFVPARRQRDHRAMGRAGKAVLGAIAGLAVATLFGDFFVASAQFRAATLPDLSTSDIQRIRASGYAEGMYNAAFLAMFAVPLGLVVGLVWRRREAD